jgi:hypothetical protein
MTNKRKVLLVILSVPLGAMNGALAGFAFGFILAFVYGWNPYFASIKGAMSCSLIGIPTGLIGSTSLLIALRARSQLAFFIVCGAFIASLLFLVFAENASEVKSGLLGGIAMGSFIGAIIGGCMLSLTNALKQQRNKHYIEDH